ncbi:hypothetical protein OC844_006457 [Tilletia horrida]|nr:hypothetical protein OC844_006457 [Tilletia horrida]
MAAQGHQNTYIVSSGVRPYADQTNGCDLIAKTCPSSEYHQAYMTCMCSNWKMLSGSVSGLQAAVTDLID